MKKQLQSSTNFGVFTDISKSFNLAFGDQTGRTISLRTAQGFKNVFKCDDMHEDVAELIVHSGMLAAYYLLNSKNKNEQGSGVLLSLALLFCYQAGK